MSEKNAVRIQNILETLFLALTGIYLLWQFSTQTTFYMQIPPLFNRLLFGSITLIAFLRIFCSGFPLKRTVISVGAALIYCLVYLNDRYPFLLYAAVIIVGMTGTDY